MKPGNVPTAKVGPILGKLIRDRWPHGNGVDVLAEKAGCDWTAVEGIVKGVHEGVSFDLIDKLFCCLGRVDLWQGALKDVYDSVDLTWRECALDSCSKMLVERAGNNLPRLYCSYACCKLASKVRNGEGTGKRYAARNRCLRGHKMEGDNVVLNKLGDGTVRRQCRQCKRITALKASRKYQAKKKAERLAVAA